MNKFFKIIHLFPPNLASFAPLRESIPCSSIPVTGKFAQVAQTVKDSSTKDTKGSKIKVPNFVIFVLLFEIICAACANFSMRQSQEGGFQTRPYDSQFFSAPFAFFAAILLFGCVVAALVPSW